MALVPANELNRLREASRRFAGGFTPGQKAVTIAAALAVVIGGIVFMNFAGKPTYAPLFTNLQPSDAANITAKLTSDKVPFQLSNNGSTVMVPANDVSTERLSLAQAGLPASSTVGLSLLDKEGITTSSMTQQADYLQALQGELEQTIDAIHGVAGSQVNIALPANQTFSLNSNNPTGASVLVTMQPGQTLSGDEVSAIVHLVGSSVPNLDTTDVTVADNSGDLLAGPGVSASAGGNNATQAFDTAQQAKIQAYLTSVLGEGNADVQVNAQLNYDQVQTQTQQILPGPNGQPVSFCTQSNTSNQTYSGNSTPGGTAGATTGTASSGSGGYNQTQSNQTCETNQQTVTDTQAPGTVKSQSVAVLVNTHAIPKGTSLAALQQGVAAAAGINATRGDVLAFSSMPFSQTAAKQAAAAAAEATAASKKQSMNSLMRMAAVVVVIAIALFLLWRSSKKARTPQSTVIPPEMLAAAQMRALQSDVTAQLPTVSMADLSRSNEAADVNRFIDAQPDDVASMLRTWIRDSRGVPAQ
ncbi:MAG TPA: flagellar basal-body MS-ring/collar protein FliF [Acidimicrobiales bacterium]|nr:flagellar basal-body MS-ring/collar protein FliF [Acidimicrobiales bacterium]